MVRRAEAASSPTPVLGMKSKQHTAGGAVR
jgi:hypothetical protein